MREPSKGDVPPGWGQDKLTEFLDKVRANQLGAFANRRGAINRLAAIDEAFITILGGSSNPGQVMVTMLFFRCQSALRGAAGLAMAGQAVESYSLNRSALEFAGYALHIFRNPTLDEVWLNRNRNQSSTDAARHAFSHKKVLKSVVAADRQAGERFEALYQQAIDLGAHPNQLAVMGNMEIVDENGSKQMRSIELHGGGIAQNLALKTTVLCGLVSLDLMQCVYAARFELLGLNSKLSRLKAGL
jgi:hypothetical protein